MIIQIEVKKVPYLILDFKAQIKCTLAVVLTYAVLESVIMVGTDI